MKYLYVLAVMALLATAEKRRYDKFNVYRVYVDSEEKLQILEDLYSASASSDSTYRFWTTPKISTHRGVDIMVPPTLARDFFGLMESRNFDYEIFMDDVQRFIDNENPEIIPKAYNWTAYFPLEDVYSWLDEQIALNPTILTSVVIGHSHQERELRGVKLSYKTGNRAVFLESGTDSKDWIAVAVSTYILNELLYSSDIAIRDVAENFDWYIFPVLNPDGYVYTHTSDRIWVKTREPNNAYCTGTYANHNWPFEWNPDYRFNIFACAPEYAGFSPWSTREMRNLGHFITSIADTVDLYVSFHTYGQDIFVPYGYTENRTIPNIDQMIAIGNRAAESLATFNNTYYNVGVYSDLNGGFLLFGSTLDWAYAVAKIPFSYMYDLPDLRQYGFLMPGIMIENTGIETTNSIVTLVQEVRLALGGQR